MEIQNAVIYARERHEDKKKADLIIEKQLTSTRNHSKNKGYSIVKEFWDYSSARNFDRKYYQVMRTFISKNKNNIDLLLFDHGDRFSRNIILALKETRYYKKLGVEVRSIK
jgi:DNA invertase Pin-like site-specific DNA recombinase